MQPDISTCCQQCSNSLDAWKALQADPNATPAFTDTVCVAYTFNQANGLCELKNAVL